VKLLRFKTFYILSLIISFPVYAGETGHYVNGVEGIKAASIPPPGFYYLMYNAFYNADTLMDEQGDELNIGFDASIYAMANRFVWISDRKVLGADYGMSALVPFINADIKILGTEDEQFELGDIYVEPLVFMICLSVPVCMRPQVIMVDWLQRAKIFGRVCLL